MRPYVSRQCAVRRVVNNVSEKPAASIGRTEDGDCVIKIASYWLIKMNTIKYWKRYAFNVPTMRSTWLCELLLALASTVIPGFRSRRDI
jgi:hypothetical protein